MKKSKKTILISLIALAAVIIAAWGICETAGSDSYSYQGYILDMRTTSDGTILTTISGDKLAEFTVKWYSRQKFNGEAQEIKIGNFIKLSTTGKSSDSIKKLSVYEGYSKDGKLVYMKDLASPFILAKNKLTNTFELYSLISANDDSQTIANCIPITIYYQYPLASGNVSVVADIIRPTSDIPQTLTEEEIAFITAAGYTPG